VTRGKTSPSTWRRQRQVDWTRELPASAIANVSIATGVWRWFGNEQPNTTESFRPEDWLDRSVTEPGRSDDARTALAVATALFRQGAAERRRLVTLLPREPQFAAPWLRALAAALRR
jgi:hypothetical protein